MPHAPFRLSSLTPVKILDRRSGIGAIAATLVFGLASGGVVGTQPAAATTPVAASAHRTSVESATNRAGRGVTLVASHGEVEEGDRFTVTARIKSYRQAATLTFEELEFDIFGTASWEQVKRVRVRGRSTVSHRFVATKIDEERLRATVRYEPAARGKPSKTARSTPIKVKVWRWVPLSEFAPYYETSYVGFGNVSINGRSYRGWGPRTYSSARSWEARFTPGRNCRSFRSVLGVADSSDDGSSGTIALTADNLTVYTSPPLTPGMDQVVDLDIRLPYRLGFQVADTSVDPEGVDLRSWPVLGDPALLCRNLP